MHAVLVILEDPGKDLLCFRVFSTNSLTPFFKMSKSFVFIVIEQWPKHNLMPHS